MSWVCGYMDHFIYRDRKLGSLDFHFVDMWICKDFFLRKYGTCKNVSSHKKMLEGVIHRFKLHRYNQCLRATYINLLPCILVIMSVGLYVLCKVILVVEFVLYKIRLQCSIFYYLASSRFWSPWFSQLVLLLLFYFLALW
jgi:hypothetical protein